MREAPASVVAAVQVALQCAPDDFISPAVCLTHACCTWSDRGCWDAVAAADAAWAVAYPAALRDAAERLEGYSHQDGKSILGRAAARGTASTLRCWADESEAPK